MLDQPTADKVDGTGDFAGGLLDPAVETPHDAKAAQNRPAHKRYNVYRNNATVSLINAVGDIFPAVKRIVGDSFFREAARAYIRKSPPTSPLLFRYGTDFATFLENFEPAGKMPYLADVARLERAWLTAFHAADAPCLDPEILSTTDPNVLPLMQFSLHPATHVVPSPFPIFEMFAMNRDMMELGPVNLAEAQTVLITRPVADVQVTAIDTPTAMFLFLLGDGQTFGQAVSATLEEHPGFQLPAALSLCLSQGAFAAQPES